MSTPENVPLDSTATVRLVGAINQTGSVKNPFPTQAIGYGLLGGDRHDDELIEVIQEDPRLTANVLRRANSAFYSRGVGIESVEDAIVRLGYGTLREILLTCFMDGFYHQQPVPKEKTAIIRAIFDHSIATAIICRGIAPRLPAGAERASTAFTAGLLHHLGLYLMVARMEGYLESVHELHQRTPRLNWDEAETQLFSSTHAETGGMFLKLWELPLSIVLSVRWHHHSPEDSEAPYELNELVRIGSLIANTPERESPVATVSQLSEKAAVWAKRYQTEIVHLHDSLGGLRGRLHHLCPLI